MLAELPDVAAFMGRVSALPAFGATAPG